MAEVLLRTKQRVPSLRQERIERPRLLAQLEDAPAYKLVLVSAPAGFGKTTLAAQWVQAVTDGAAASVSWLSLDAGDNEPLRFFSYFLAACEGGRPTISQALQRPLQSPEPPPLSMLVTLLLNEWLLQTAEASGPHLLVLDDFHLITQAEILEAICLLLENLPPDLRLIVVTRRDPPLPLPRLRARRELLEIRAADLRFSESEAAEFLSQIMRLKLPQEDVLALEKRTEGWIAGLQLAALSLQGQTDTAEFIANFNGGHRYIIDYLADEVIQRQPVAVQQFLLKTAVLGRFTSSLCDALHLTGASDASLKNGRILLAEIEAANLFLIPLDDERQWYRYHHLFADCLYNRLRQRYPERVVSLRRQAARWFWQVGLYDEAVDQAAAAEDWPLAATIIHEAQLKSFSRGAIANILGWFNRLPTDFVQRRLDMLIMGGWADIMIGRLNQAAGHVAQAEKLLREIEPNLSADDSGLAWGNLLNMQGRISLYRDDMETAVKLAQKALSRLPEAAADQRCVSYLHLGNCYIDLAQWAAGEAALLEALRLSRQGEQPYLQLSALNLLAQLAMEQAQLQTAARYLQEGAALERSMRERNRPVLAETIYLGLGALYYERNDLTQAAAAFRQALDYTDMSGHDGFLQTHIGLARLHQAQGQNRKARMTLEQVMTDTPFGAGRRIRAVASGWQCRLALMGGDITAARAYLAQALALLPEESDERGACFPERARLHLIEVRLHLAAGEAKTAEERLRQFGERFGDLDYPTLSLERYIVAALTAYANGKRPKAFADLERALSLAERAGFVRIFVEEGQMMRELLEETAERPGYSDYLARLLAAFPQPAAASASVLAEPLTKRERATLQLLAADLSITEIAEQLFVEVSTIRTYTKFIYRKLDVHSRAEAVYRARELKLL